MSSAESLAATALRDFCFSKEATERKKEETPPQAQ